MELHLQNKRAIVTGGTRGIGRAIVEGLAKEGAHVAFCARHKKDIETTNRYFREHYRNTIVGTSVDVSDSETFSRWIKASAEQLGGIDILILNAAAMVGENTKHDWEVNFNVDLMSAVIATTTAQPYLEDAVKASNDAAVIFISSVSALEAQNISSYGPIKAALIHFAKGIAKENGHKRIRTNVISPGPIYFENGYWQQHELNDKEMFNRVVNQIALKRMGTPEEVANAVLFLASPVAAFITGSNLVIDGAFTSRV